MVTGVVKEKGLPKVKRCDRCTQFPGLLLRPVPGRQTSCRRRGGEGLSFQVGAFLVLTVAGHNLETECAVAAGVLPLTCLTTEGKQA